MAIVLPYRGFDIHVDDLERPYFEAAAEGRLIVQMCAECSIVRYPPSSRCPACGISEGGVARHERQRAGLTPA